MTIDEREWMTACDALSSASRVSLACHVGPDGDALGSMLALGLALRARGCEVRASWGSDPFVPPRLYSFLPGLDLLAPPADVEQAPALMVTFDAGSLDRLGSLERNARAAKTLVVVDHHASNDHFGSVNLVDPAAAASAVLVHGLLRRLGWDFGSDVATCLYAGLVTDTGRFQYSNTTPEVHAIAGDLLAHGVEHDRISREIYDTHAVGYLKLAGDVLSRVEADNGFVWTYVTQEDLKRHAVELEDIDGLIDLVRSADSADVAAILKQQEDGRYRVSVRSKGGTDVGALCEGQGGGGHALAAGYTGEGTDPHVLAATIAALVPQHARTR